MKILISADMEGISGIVAGEQVDSRSGKEFEWARELMTQEVNYAIEGAFDGGAKEVIVNDSHGGMRNIIPDKLHPEATLISGSLKELSMVQGLSNDVDGLFLVGYHGRRGTRGSILDHTYSGRVLRRLKINEVELGETGMNALVAGEFDVPVLLVTGDNTVCKEAGELLEGVYTVQVKEGLSRYAAHCLHPQKAGELIKQKAKEAVKDISGFEPFKLEAPYRLELEVPERRIDDIELGQRGELVLSAISGVSFPFEVERITPQTRSSDGSTRFVVEANFLEESLAFRPGMQGVGKIDVGEDRLLSLWTDELRHWLRLNVWRWWG